MNSVGLDWGLVSYYLRSSGKKVKIITNIKNYSISRTKILLYFVNEI